MLSTIKDGKIIGSYIVLENEIINLLKSTPYIHQFIHDPISGRITLYLLILGTFALIQELCISFEMICLQKETYDELNLGRIDEGIKLHRMLVSDEYHGKEWYDEKQGIVIEEFEDRDKFFSKPVFVSSLVIDGYIIVDGVEKLEKPLKYRVEISPEEFEDEKRQDFGCNLHVLRTKLYHLFKDSELYNELMQGRDESSFTISKSVRVYNRLGEVLPTTVDDVQLCFLKLETGDRINCEFIIGNE